MNLQEIFKAIENKEIVMFGEAPMFILGYEAEKRINGDCNVTVKFLKSNIDVIFSWKKDQSEISKWKLKKDCKSPIIEDQKTDEFAISMALPTSNNLVLLTNRGRVFCKGNKRWEEIGVPDYKTFK